MQPSTDVVPGSPTKWTPDWWDHVLSFSIAVPVACVISRDRTPDLRRLGCRRSRGFGGLTALLLFLPLFLISWAAEASQEVPATAKKRVVKQEITGEVVAATKRSLSLEIARTANTSEEMLLPVNPDTVKLDHVTSLADLKRGDVVRVEYHQTLQDMDDGESRLMWTEAAKISFLGRGIGGQGLRSVEGGR